MTPKMLSLHLLVSIHGLVVESAVVALLVPVLVLQRHEGSEVQICNSVSTMRGRFLRRVHAHCLLAVASLFSSPSRTWIRSKLVALLAQVVSFMGFLARCSPRPTLPGTPALASRCPHAAPARPNARCLPPFATSASAAAFGAKWVRRIRRRPERRVRSRAELRLQCRRTTATCWQIGAAWVKRPRLCERCPHPRAGRIAVRQLHRRPAARAEERPRAAALTLPARVLRQHGRNRTRAGGRRRSRRSPVPATRKELPSARRTTRSRRCAAPTAGGRAPSPSRARSRRRWPACGRRRST